MIEFENVVPPSPEQWRSIIIGTRNAMNSWNKSDSQIMWTEDPSYYDIGRPDLAMNMIIGPNDHELMMKLCKAGTDHRKFMRMIVVYVDIIAPLYFWKEADTYKVGTVVNSCSTMHKIHEKEFTLEDFSHEQLINITKPTKELIDNDCVRLEDIDFRDTLYLSATNILEVVIGALNTYRQRYLETKDKKYWRQIIQLLPSSYNQRRTVMLNYEVLANIYKSRRNHKLDEWVELCKWIESLPYSELITAGLKKEIDI